MRGELRVVSRGDTPFPAGVTRVRLGGGAARVYELCRVRPAHGAWLVTLAGVGDRDAAAALAGAELAVEVGELPPPGDGELYVFELEGATVVDEQGRTLGVVASLLERPAQDLLRVEGPDGELLLPYVAEIVLGFDRPSRTLLVRPPAGLWHSGADDRRQP